MPLGALLPGRATKEHLPALSSSLDALLSLSTSSTMCCTSYVTAMQSSAALGHRSQLSERAAPGQRDCAMERHELALSSSLDALLSPFTSSTICCVPSVTACMQSSAALRHRSQLSERAAPGQRGCAIKRREVALSSSLDASLSSFTRGQCDDGLFLCCFYKVTRRNGDAQTGAQRTHSADSYRLNSMFLASMEMSVFAERNAIGQSFCA